MKNLLCILMLISALALSALAQDKTSEKTTALNSPKPVKTVKEGKSALPASAEFTKEQWEAIEAKRKDARLALLEADNLRLNLEKAQADYQKLSDTARKSQAAYSDLLYATAEKLGIPKDELPNYEFSDADGKFTLKRKADPKAATKPN